MGGKAEKKAKKKERHAERAVGEICELLVRAEAEKGPVADACRERAARLAGEMVLEGAQGGDVGSDAPIGPRGHFAVDGAAFVAPGPVEPFALSAARTDGSEEHGGGGCEGEGGDGCGPARVGVLAETAVVALSALGAAAISAAVMVGFWLVLIGPLETMPGWIAAYPVVAGIAAAGSTARGMPNDLGDIRFMLTVASFICFSTTIPLYTDALFVVGDPSASMGPLYVPFIKAAGAVPFLLAGVIAGDIGGASIWRIRHHRF